MSSYIHLDVERIARETDMALLLVIDGDELWVPKSVIADADTYGEGDEDVTVSVQMWFAEKEGLA